MANRKSRWNQKRKRIGTERRKNYEARQSGANWSGSARIKCLAWCGVHQKEAFHRRDARKVPRRLHEPGMRAYPCDAYPENDWWHIGHLPQNVRLGYVTANEVYGKESA